MASTSTPSPQPGQQETRGTALIIIGMAGSGKTTLLQRLNAYLHSNAHPPPPSPTPTEKPKTDSEKTEDLKDMADDRGDNDQRGKGKEKEKEKENIENLQRKTSSSSLKSKSKTKSKSKSKAAPVPPYIVNLDPAVMQLPYEDYVAIDIRENVKYKEVMKQYSLGPNGAILTSLNLFTTKFDQVLGLIGKRSWEVSHVLIDTPGQIEIFTWSASGAIITDALASELPTAVVFVVDTPRSIETPATFMSNMLYACSIMYKTRLPFLIAFNKIDVPPPTSTSASPDQSKPPERSHEIALSWMRDFECFQEALAEKRKRGFSRAGGGYGGEEEGGEYMDSLMHSMSLVLDEFYKTIKAVGVSAMTGEGMKGFFDAVDELRVEYDTEYKPELDLKLQEKDVAREKAKSEQLARLVRDMKVGGGSKEGVGSGSSSSKRPLKKGREMRRGRGDEDDEEMEDGDVEDEDEDEDEAEVLHAGSSHPFLDILASKRGRGGLMGSGSGGGEAIEEDDVSGARWPKV